MRLRRRTLTAVILAPAIARAQATRRVPVVGFFGLASAASDRPGLEALRRGLAEAGFTEPAGVHIVSRYGQGDAARAAEIIRELVALPVDVFVVPGQALARAVRRATTIPLVAIALPPVASEPELFASLARPGGSVTGFSSFGEEISAKRIGILRELMPGLRAVGILHNAADPTFDAWGAQTERDVRARDIEALRAPIRSADPAETAAAIAMLKARGAGAVIVVRDFLTATMTPDILRSAAAAGIAVVSEQRDTAEAGALFSYGANLPDLFRRAGGYVARILRGERPGDLPVQLPTVIELVVNLKTARALGLVVPPALIAAADEVVE